MAKVRCEAIIDEPRLRENLCQCVGILGYTPQVARNRIVVECEGEKANKMVELFEQFHRHSIHITN